MRLKRKYKRLRYHCSWRYPKLYGIARKLAFPLQVSALCLALYAAVNLYQQHYSFDAALRSAQSQVPATVLKGKPLKFDAVTPLAAVKDGILNATPGSASEVIPQADQKASVELAIGQADGTVPAAPIITKLQPSTKKLRNGDWILSQNGQSAVIQLASSSDEAELQNYALELPLAGPLAMYPYKRTNNGILIYGLSTGLYDSKALALSALASLPEASNRYGTWVREVAELSPRISALKLEPPR